MGNYFFFRILEGKYSLYKKIMLYKKYHRNFVKQFKKGAEFKLKRDSNYIRTQTVITEPFVGNFTTRRPHIIVEVTEDTVVSLVHYSGRFNSNIIVEDVV